MVLLFNKEKQLIADMVNVFANRYLVNIYGKRLSAL